MLVLVSRELSFLALATELLELLRNPGRRYRLERSPLLICRHGSLSSNAVDGRPAPALCPRPAHGVQSSGGICSGPRDIGRRAVGGRHWVLHQPKTQADLRPMVSGM